MTDRGPALSVAFLLAQVGGQAAARFAERMGELELTPAQAGILNAVRAGPGISQQTLADRLGMLPSALVGFIDGLEERGLLERARSDTDRRRNSLLLTAAGNQTLAAIGALARAHDEELCAALTPAQRDRLADLLTRIASAQGLQPGVHPGFRTLRSAPPAPASARPGPGRAH
jgi:DNA-binding MarR family transcriptional regulator